MIIFSGYLPRMYSWFSVIKSVNVIYHVNRLKEKSHRTFFTDPEKKLMKPSINYDNKGYVKNSNIRCSEHHTKLGKIENR